jgi:hypothetical protein
LRKLLFLVLFFGSAEQVTPCTDQFRRAVGGERRERVSRGAAVRIAGADSATAAVATREEVCHQEMRVAK